jgi:hypothetical protein
MTVRIERLLAAALVATGIGVLGCGREIAAPSQGPLANSRWTGDGACLSVTDEGCNLVVGCGHGVFSRPIVRGDGSFDVDGTYRIEVGPISIAPAPPAHFSGEYTEARMTKTTAGTCVVPCL